MSESLFLLHCQPDPRRLIAWAVQHRLLGANSGDPDLGYALHALLHAVFGTAAPQPFIYDVQGLLAYTPLSPESLAQAVALADIHAADALGLSASAQSPGYRLRGFPTHWQVGQVLGFTVRVRPIEREGKTGSERDAFLGAALAAPDQALSREAVYAAWLAEQLGPRTQEGGSERQPWQGGAELVDAQMTRFALTPVMRRTQAGTGAAERKSRRVIGPDATLSGHLRVQDSAAFAALLARGVGRHRAFGFGMLHLRPAGTTAAAG